MAKYYKKRTVFKRTYKKKKVSLGKQLIRMADSKSHSIEVSLTGMIHNTIGSISPTQLLTQGTGNTNRIGDSVYLQNLVINGYYTCPAVANSICRLRVIVMWSRNILDNQTFVTGVVPTTDIFLPGTATIATNGIVNTKACTILADVILEVNPSISTAKDIKSFAMTVPLNQTFDYVAAGSSKGKRKNLFIVAIPFKVGGGLVDAGDVVFSHTLKFKDP